MSHSEHQPKPISSRLMGRRLGWGAAALVLFLALGAGVAGGRTLATTTITVEVIGKGTVTSDPAGIKCGNGKKICYLTFTGSEPTIPSPSRSSVT